MSGFWSLLLVGLLLAPLPGWAATVRVNDLDYIHRTYFFIADHPIEWDPASLLVMRDDAVASNNAGIVQCRARPDPTTPPSTSNPEYFGYFDFLTQGVDYDLILPYPAPGQSMIPVIRLAAPLPPDAALAVYYIERTGEGSLAVGNRNLADSDSVLGKRAGELLLKMIGTPAWAFFTLPGGQFDPASPWYPT